MFWGNKLRFSVNKKSFHVNTNETRSYQGSIKRRYDAVSQTPMNKKCLIIANTKRDVDRNHDNENDLEEYAMEVKEV